MPGEEILVANKHKKYTKRKGDANLIILEEKILVINPKGWILKYKKFRRVLWLA